MISNSQIETIDVNSPFFPFSLDFHSDKLTEKQFEELCRNNRDLKFELTAKGELIIVPPTSPESGWRNTDIITEVNIWSKKNRMGIVFDSSTMFTLPNGAKRSPDVSWMILEKWNDLTLLERRKFSRVVPDFVIELRAPSAALADLQNKMIEYIENGVSLGWLIDPLEQKVYICRENEEPETLENPEMISGENILRDFEFDVRTIW